jgi:hypothetical protein
MRAMFLAPLFLVACAIDSPDMSTTEQHTEIDNRLAGNRLAGNRLAGNRLAGNRLAGNSLSSTRLEALEATADMLKTEDGREVYSYMVGCALEEGMTIEATVPSAPDVRPPDFNYTCKNHRCKFSGGVGLAPGWAWHRLGETDQRWVSACLFARVNAHNAFEMISLRGRNDALGVSWREASKYTLQEGAFYGNLFTDDPDPNAKPDWHACRGADQAAGEYGGLELRDCAEPDPANPGLTQCGFQYAGDCGDYSYRSRTDFACEWFDWYSDGYQNCHDRASRFGGNGPRYREVITVYVAD